MSWQTDLHKCETEDYRQSLQRDWIQANIYECKTGMGSGFRGSYCARYIGLGYSRPCIGSKRERYVRARSIAVAIFPDILQVGASVQHAAHVLKSSIDMAHKETREGRRMLAEGAAARDFKDAAIAMPNMLNKLDVDLWRLGHDLGAIALEMVALLHQWNALVQRGADRLGTPQDHDLLMHLQGNLEALRITVESTKRGIERLRDR